MAEQEIKVPDIGGASNVDVIEILVKEGDEINKETPLITLESDKASMEIPSPFGGTVKSLRIKVGDKVSEGNVILTIDSEDKCEQGSKKESVAQEEKISEKKPQEKKEEQLSTNENKDINTTFVSEKELSQDVIETSGEGVTAGPAVRRLAREFGVNLTEVEGSGRKLRITKEDVQNFVKTKLKEKNSNGLAIPSAPEFDFSKFGNIDIKPLNKIKKLTGINVHRSWITIPHVTQFDEADITELEAFRKSQIEENKNSDYKLTILAFVCKVVAKALQKFPQFNTSLDAKGEQLIFKHYYNVGVAVETLNGLVVPVIKEVDRLSIGEVAREMSRLSAKARDKGLMPADMNGGCFTISSLGGIGGTSFTPIVNSPEVAILGLSRALMKPVYVKESFVPRLMLPLSLSYDHRVIDGAEAARFTRYICDSLSDIRKILL